MFIKYTPKWWEKVSGYGDDVQLLAAIKEYLLSEDHVEVLNSLNLNIEDLYDVDSCLENLNHMDQSMVLSILADWNETLGWQEFKIPDTSSYIASQDEDNLSVDDSEDMSDLPKEEKISIMANAMEMALSSEYGYGVSSDKNSFGAVANRKSAEIAYTLIEGGIEDEEELASALHDGWSLVAISDFNNELALTEETDNDKKLRRMVLAIKNYRDLPEEEKEKDRVAARAALENYL